MNPKLSATQREYSKFTSHEASLLQQGLKGDVIKSQAQNELSCLYFISPGKQQAPVSL